MRDHLSNITLLVALLLTGYFTYTDNLTTNSIMIVSVLYTLWTIKYMIRFYLGNKVDIDAELLRRLNEHKELVEESLKKTYADINTINAKLNTLDVRVNGSDLGKTINKAPRF
jgi:small-conductance mechanosensitive channel